MLENKRIAFIGSGTIAQSMIAGLVNQNLVDPQHVIASGPRKLRGEQLTKRYGIRHTTKNINAVRDADIVVLSVKPQVIPEVLEELQDKGMSVWTATDTVSEAQRGAAQAIFRSLGKEIFVSHEYYLDMATALSGSGPAYVFLFIEALVDAGVHMGFSRNVAEELVLQTMEGSVEFARQHRRHPAELRNMVTSPGGTTADALYQLEKGGFRTITSKAVFAAYQKSKKLGGNNS